MHACKLIIICTYVCVMCEYTCGYIHTYVHVHLLGEISEDGKKVPYSKLSSLGINLSGLPENVSLLKHPSSYGRRQLQAILDNKQRLKFSGKHL